jgi:hypothetical protein
MATRTRRRIRRLQIRQEVRPALLQRRKFASVSTMDVGPGDPDRKRESSVNGTYHAFVYLGTVSAKVQF